jgi:hypothetical protein
MKNEFYNAQETLESIKETPPKERDSAWNQPQGRKEWTKIKLLCLGETLYSMVQKNPNNLKATYLSCGNYVRLSGPNF